MIDNIELKFCQDFLDAIIIQPMYMTLDNNHCDY